MASRAQLVKLILQNLGVWQAGQDLPAEDYQVVNERLPFALLAAGRANVVTVDPESIPDDMLEPLAAYLSQSFILPFGLVGEEKQNVIDAAAGGEQALRFMRVMDATGQPVRIQSF